MQLALRPFEESDADYEAVVAIHNASFPEYAEQPADWRHWDGMLVPPCKAERWIAEHEGRTVGYGHYFQVPWSYQPHKFYLGLEVHPEHRRQGIGGRIYDHLLARLEPSTPQVVRADGREDKVESIAFARKRGFIDEMRVWESRLDLTSFDPSPWASHEAKVLARGVRITTLRQLLDTRGDALKPELYEALMEMGRDVPRPDAYTPVAFEQWQSATFGDQNLMPEAYFLALVGGAIAGVSQLWRHGGDPTVLNTGLTATRRDFRRMGIALALKLRAIAYAQGAGYREVRTGNESNNRAMLSINEALGYVKQPVWITMVKTFPASS
jgi:GNAT superfamily N-acetyltransferase